MFHFKKIVLIGVTCFFGTMEAKKVKIAFFVNFLSVRGIEVATYDYADCNETILGNESIVINYTAYLRPGKLDYSDSTRQKYIKRFGNRFFDAANMQEVNDILRREKCDIFYAQKAGERDDKVSKVCKNAIHAVFGNIDPHGDVYACISEWLSMRYAGGRLPNVPYMVRLADTEETLHHELGIPEGAVVFGRHGGFDQFDIKYAKSVVRQIAQEHSDWYFLFLNTEKFCELPNVIFLPLTADMVYKTKFINTCDAMLHARKGGETFGLACAEFSIKNKPVITCSSKGDMAHRGMLGEKGLYYANKNELLKLVRNVGENIAQVRAGDWDAYSQEYSPEAVMKKFDKVFIKPLVK